MKFKQIINSFSAWTVDRLTSARRATLTMLATFLIAMTAQTAWAQDPATIGSISYNSELGAYEIKNVDNLNDLAVYVNGSGNYSTTGSENTPHDCVGLTFKMTDNITYAPDVLTIDNNGDNNKDSNFKPIGGYTGENHSSPYAHISFKGHFDGNGKTISGIRIYRRGDSVDGWTDWCQGLFGMLNGGEVKNVILDNTIITGYNYCGGIVGWNNGGTISNCKVTSSVTIGTCTRDGVNCHGGIAGSNDSGVISGCVSSVQLTTASQQDIIYYGGIAGTNDNGGTLRDNLVIDATIPVTSGGYYGAITGLSGNITDLSGNESCNYYVNCTVAGTPNATNVGVGGSKTNGPSDAAGARQALTVTFPTNGIPSGTATEYNVSGITGYADNNIILYNDGTNNIYYAGASESVALIYTGAEGYDAEYKVNGNAISGNSFTMPATAATITATPVDVWGVTGGAADGSKEKPYIIKTTGGLAYLAQKVNAGTDYSGKYFKLGDDITYDGTANNFTPIGNVTKPFKGTFDGNGKTISGLNVNLPETDNVGLFGAAVNATIKGVKLDNSTITGKNNVGGIVGQGDASSTPTTIENCTVTSNVSVSGAYRVGGIVGLYAKVRVCTSAAAVSGVQIVGGIVGQGDFSTIECCLYTGSSVTASGDSYHGAITGLKNNNTSMTANYYTANLDCKGINGSDEAGARKALTVTLPDGVVPSGTATAYNVSGITSYVGKSGYDDDTNVNHIILYNDGTTSTYYSGAGESVIFLINYDGYQVSVTDADGNVDFTKDIKQTDATHIYYNYTFTMPAKAVTITATDVWGAASGKDGSTADKAYTITGTAGLDLLAQKVNAGTDYSGTYFKLGKDIEYDPTVLTIDNNGDSNADSNFTPIGNNTYQFKGTFDGNGKTISGIKIDNPSTDLQGVFGYLEGIVKNLVVSSCSIEGRHDVGAIAGKLKKGIIENCSASDVILSGNGYVGGIVGASEKGTIIGCASAATITGIKISNNNAYDLGGIAGATTTATDPSVLTNNLFTGTISDNREEYIGAIVGINANGTLTNNLYTFTGLGGVGVASGSEQSTTGADEDGAHKAVEISAAEGVTITPTGTKTTYNVSGITAYTDNNFIGYDSKLYAGATQAATFSIDYTEPEGYMFEGFDAGEGVGIVLNEGVYNLAVPASGNVTISPKLKDLTLTLDKIVEFETLAIDENMQSYVENGALKLKVTPKNKFWTLACGVDLLLPEGIVVYKARMNSAGTKVDLTEISDSELNGVLKANNGVLIASTPGESYEFKVSPDNSVTTLSTADAKSYGNDNQLVPVLEETHFDSENYFILTDNQFVMVDVSQDTKVPVGKAVLKVPAGTAQARAFGIDANDTTGDTTGINAALENAGEEVWYNLQGQRISKPTRKGIYILNGKKVRM